MMLSDVCLSDRVQGLKSRTGRPRKTKIDTEVAHVARDSDTTFKVIGHQATLLTAALTHQAAAVVSVGTYNVLSVGIYCYIAVRRRGRLGGARRFGAHRGRRGAGAYCGCSHTACHLVQICCCQNKSYVNEHRAALLHKLNKILLINHKC